MFCFKSFALISKVLFEITLLREWKKLLAAQILQRTLLVYISIKNNFFLILGVGLSAFPSVPPPFFEVGKWCKGKCYFLNHQIFLKEFFQKFSEPFLLSFRTVFLIRSGCKDKSFFWISKRFRNFFQNFSEPVFVFRSSVSLSKRVQR